MGPETLRDGRTRAALIVMVVFEPFDDNAAAGCRQSDNAAGDPAGDLCGQIPAVHPRERRQLAVLSKAQCDFVRPSIYARLARQGGVVACDFQLKWSRGWVDFRCRDHLLKGADLGHDPDLASGGFDAIPMEVVHPQEEPDRLVTREKNRRACIPNVSEDPGCQDGNAARLALPDKETFGGFGRKRS